MIESSQTDISTGSTLYNCMELEMDIDTKVGTGCQICFVNSLLHFKFRGSLLPDLKDIHQYNKDFISMRTYQQDFKDDF